MKHVNLRLCQRLAVIAAGSVFAAGTCTPGTTVLQDPNSGLDTGALQQALLSGAVDYLAGQVLYYAQNPEDCPENGGTGVSGSGTGLTGTGTGLFGSGTSLFGGGAGGL